MSDVLDPTLALDPSCKRRTFVGAAGFAAAASLLLPTLAQSTELGKPHGPFVPENDPPIEVLHMRSMYQASPKHASPSAPGVVVVQAIWGIDAQLRDVVRRFAKAGYVAAAPDLYVDLNAPNADASSDFAPFREIAAKLVDENVDAQIATAAKHLRMGAAHRKIGVTGFCMGGGITLRQTIVNASLFQAAAMWYDKVNDPSLADSVKVPLLGSFGARDTSIPPDDVRAFEQRLKIAHDFKIYEEAGHAFFDDTRRSYIGSAAADAWHRTLAWFKAYLSQSGQRSVALGGGESSVYP